MFFNFVHSCLQNNSTSVGIDVGNSYATLIKIRKKQDNHSIIDCKTCANNDMFESLNNSTSGKSTNHISPVMALKYHLILTKTIDLDPSLTYSEIKKYLDGNTEKYFGLYPKDIYMDFIIHKKNPKTYVQMLAVKRDYVNAVLTLSTKANIKLKALDVEHFALTRAVLSLFKLQKNEVVVAINSKDEHLLFCFICNKRIVYVTEISVLDNINQPIITELQLFFTINNILVTRLILSGNDCIKTTDAMIIEDAIKSKITLSIANPLALCASAIPNGLSAHSFMLSYGLALWNNKL
jgi:Tfp pilus assembly PilM family ATPase